MRRITVRGITVLAAVTAMSGVFVAMPAASGATRTATPTPAPAMAVESSSLVQHTALKHPKERKVRSISDARRIAAYRARVEAARANTPAGAKAYARSLVYARGWNYSQYLCLNELWFHESRWEVHAQNASGAYGIPQALPGAKMAAAGSAWRNSAKVQVKWGISYIASQFGTPCNAWSFWQSHYWY